MKAIPQRTAVPKEFTDLIVEVSLARLARLKKDIEEQHPRFRERFKQDHAPLIARLGELARPTTRAAAVDRITTTLRGLPYVEYGVRAGRFYGLTKPVTIERHWDMGPYQVYISPVVFQEGERWARSDIELLPDREPQAHYRHPHHSRNGTCWGSFSTIVSGLMHDANVVELFRVIYVYLGRYDPGSVLTTRLNLVDYRYARYV